MVYADGSTDFGAYVTREGKFVCESEAGLCPETVPGPVHAIAAANAEGITIQLRSGALYYRHDGRWVEDAEAVSAGVFDRELYRLTRDGNVFRGDTLICRGQTLLVTDEAALVDGIDTALLGSGGIAKLAATQTATERSSYYRKPLTVEQEKTAVLGENGCPIGYLRTESG